MLVAKVAFAVAVLLLAGLASEAKCLSRVPRSSDDRSFHAWDRSEEQDRYFEQCRFVNAWKEHLGYVSVLAFLDPAWQYSFRQAVMLELLSARLRKSGFPDIRFFVISPPSDSSTENEGSEEDFEIEAWREIGAKHEMENFVGHDFLRGNGSEITILRDDPRSRMWERFRASRDQVIIIDRCGKLTYHVIVPWSILFFPYVKAAILSTYEEDPCNGCDPTIYQTPSHEEPVKLTTVTDEEEASPTQNTEANIDAIWITEGLKNATLRYESSSEEERKASTASSVSPQEITNDTDRSIVRTESPTESTTYQYDSATEFEARADAESTREDPTNSGEGNDTIPVATFEPQRDVPPPEQAGSPPANDNSLTPVSHGDRTLSLDKSATDETKENSTPADEETTTSDLVDEARDRNTIPADTESFEEDAFLPLRIIMYAPHVHKNGREMEKHTHLILKTGDPGFHGHHDFGIDTASPTDSWQDADSRVTSSKEYDLGAMEADAVEENQKFTFDADESPGLYGEVADYWKSYEDNDITDRNETFNDTYDNSTTNYNEEHHKDVSNHATSLSKSEESYPVTNVTEDLSVENSTDPQNIVGLNTIESSSLIDTNQINREEEIRYKLMEHYKKLLPWIDYRLSK